MLALVFVAGCIGQSPAKVSSNDGIVIERFTADPSDIFDFQKTTFSLDIANTGGTTATGVEAKLLNVEKVWRIDDANLVIDGAFSSVGTLNPPRSKDGTPGDSRFLSMILEAPNLREGDSAVFPVKARVTYNYRTTGSVRMKVVSFERMQVLQNKGGSVSDAFSESNSDSPVKLALVRGTVPVIVNSQDVSSDKFINRDFRFEIQNAGSGFPISGNIVGRVGNNKIRILAPDGITLANNGCQGITGDISSFTIDLRSDGTAPFACTLKINANKFSKPTDEVSVVFDFELNYKYFVEDEVSVRVQGTRKSDESLGVVGDTGSSSATTTSLTSTTITASDTQAPTISEVLITPEPVVANGIKLVRNRAPILSLKTSEPASCQVQAGSTAKIGDSLQKDVTATLHSLSLTNLADGSYTFNVKCKDNAGNENPAVTAFVFTVDATAPAVSSKIPVGAGAAKNPDITIKFGEPMSKTTVAAAFTLKVKADGTAVAVGVPLWSADDLSVTFRPSAALSASTTYTAALTAAAKDLAGNPISETSWDFTTVA